MRAELVSQTIKALYPLRRPVIVTGPPGGGKTSIVKQVAADMEIDYIHLHPPTMLVEDFGIPEMTTDSATFDYKMPHWFPTDPDLKAILCVDDRSQCGHDLQKVFANMQQARELHGHALPEGVMIVSTGNRTEDGAGANRTLTHLSDRETEIELDTMLDDWCIWAIDHGVRHEVISFLRFKTALLHDFDPQRKKNATPRSWTEGVSSILGTVPVDAEFDCFRGAVGDGPAAEFTGYMKIFRSLPNVDNILLHPTAGEVPTDPATLYALSGSLAERANNGNFSKLVTYGNRMPPEFSVLMISYATRKNPELANTAAFTNWAVANQEVLF